MLKTELAKPRWKSNEVIIKQGQLVSSYKVLSQVDGLLIRHLYSTVSFIKPATLLVYTTVRVLTHIEAVTSSVSIALRMNGHNGSFEKLWKVWRSHGLLYLEKWSTWTFCCNVSIISASYFHGRWQDELDCFMKD